MISDAAAIEGQKGEINAASQKISGNNGAPPKPVKFNLTRRLSTNVPLILATQDDHILGSSPYSPNKAPAVDPAVLKKLDELLEKFPKTPMNTEPSKATGAAKGSQSNSSGWGFKGLAERFSLFSNKS